ncbi:MAG: hypothetical protein KIT58_02665 [Planctomycetota bacterium]|nr:hypothetical protein [Planctomycetota bacterium]
MDEHRTITEQDARFLAVVQLTLALGVVLYLGLVFVVAQSTQAQEARPDPTQVRLLALLSAAHAVAAVTAWTTGVVAYRWTLATPSGARPGARLRLAAILRLTLFEGAALFGLTVCLLAAGAGALARTPLLWLNALSVIPLLVLVRHDLAEPRAARAGRRPAPGAARARRGRRPLG